jgi:membrane-associated protein
MPYFLEVILHLDEYLQAIVSTYSTLTYLLLFGIVFLETGVVVTPFLPGDSLLFAAGALAASGSFQIGFLWALLFVAAVLGDALNYHIGKWMGPKVFRKESSLFFNPQHLLRAQSFYEKYGKKAIILARFVPIIRTFAPFVAGIGKMEYRIFLIYNLIGALIWCSLFLWGGFFFGNIPWVQDNFGILILAIIFFSLLPLAKELAVHFFTKKEEPIREDK